MKTYGLIGYPLTHSFSPAYFNEKFSKLGLVDHRFELIPLKAISHFPDMILTTPNIAGLAVTIPHKIKVMEYLDEIDDTAQKVGAVNCITIKKGRTKGYNTDVFGFFQSLSPLLQSHHNRALILGNGGAAQAVAFALNQIGIPFSKVVRKNLGNESLIEYSSLTASMIANHTLIINCTPLGMGDLKEQYPPIPYQYITSHHLLYDLIYQSEITPFLKRGAAHGAQIKNGWEMLHLQAEKNWEWWNE